MRKPRSPINCEECPLFSGGYFAGFRCDKGYAAEPQPDNRFKFVRAYCIDFRQMTEAEKIKRRWKYAKAVDIKNKGTALKRLAGSLRKQVQPDILGQYMKSDEIADLLSAAATLTRIAGHISKAASMLKADEESAIELAKQEDILARAAAARLFFGDAHLVDMPEIALDLSSYLREEIGYGSANIDFAAKQLASALLAPRDADVVTRHLHENHVALLRANLMQAVGTEVRGFKGIAPHHYFASTHKLTIAGFVEFRGRQIERRRVETAVAASPNVVPLAPKKTAKKK